MNCQNDQKKKKPNRYRSSTKQKSTSTQVSQISSIRHIIESDDEDIIQHLEEEESNAILTNIFDEESSDSDSEDYI